MVSISQHKLLSEGKLQKRLREVYPYLQSDYGHANEYGCGHANDYDYGHFYHESGYDVRHSYDSENEYSAPYIPYIGLYAQKYLQIYATKLQNGIFYAYL